MLCNRTNVSYCCLAIVALLGCLAMQRQATAASVYSTNVINRTSPTIYWDLDETSGTSAGDTAPLSGLNPGTHLLASSSSAIGPRPVDGFINMSPINDGSSVTTSGKVQNTMLGSIGISTSAYSMGLWFNSSADFTDQVLNYVFERGNDNTNGGRREAVGIGGTFGGGTTNRLFATTGGAVVTSTVDMLPDTWYHAILVRDDSLPTEKFKVYLNGDATPALTANTPWAGGVGDYFAAGNRTDLHNGLGLIGSIDEVAIWNRALTAEEVGLTYQIAVTDLAVLFPVPEPSSAMLLGMGALICLRRRRQRDRHINLSK